MTRGVTHVINDCYSDAAMTAIKRISRKGIFIQIKRPFLASLLDGLIN